MRRTSSSLLPILFDGFVVLTMIAIVGTIATLLPYAAVHRKTTYALCAFVFVLGLTAVGYQMWRILRFDRARIRISRLLAEGPQLSLTLITDQPSRDIESYPSQTFPDLDAFMLMEKWCKAVEAVLRTLDESYVTRFHLGGSLKQDERSMTIWKTRHRLETLASFLLELK